jgi:UDP-N-acetylmuramoyl-tripeptide--D-alanyl-D-alanine ligase
VAAGRPDTGFDGGSRELVLQAGQLALAMNGTLVAGDPGQPVQGFSIDSRGVVPGDLFFAIRGERLDGHQFAGAALQAGACGVVVESPPVGRPAGVLIVVEDTTRALQALANHVRRLSGTKVIAITGSAGKTTTKEAAAEFLSTRYTVIRNEGNLNNHIGLPLSLLELRHRPDVAVVELGMNHAGEIRTLVAITEPDLRVWTNVAEVHLGFFNSLDAIADAKAEMLDGADRESALIANADDPLVMARSRRFPGRVVTFGLEAPAEVGVSALRDLGLDGSAGRLRSPAGEAPFHTPLIGRANVANVLAAAAAALEFGVGVEQIAERASTLKTAPRRLQVIRLARGITLIDDSYNSNPRALGLLLELMAGDARYPQRVAVLGEMLELGDQAPRLHEACGRVAATVGLRLLVTVGGAGARSLAAGALAAGMSPASVMCAETSEEAAVRVAARVRSGDLVAVKGSRGIHTEVVVERLRAELA